MDLLNLITPEALSEFTENYNYKVSGYMGQSLFPARKTRNIKLSYYDIVDGGDIPVMAQVHSLDTEARIGERPNYVEIKLEKMLIKEKLNLTERMSVYLNQLGGAESSAAEFVFNDSANLISRVITRTEVANMELLSTGKITVDENNAKFTVDYGFKNDNKIAFTGWSNPEHSILDDINRAIDKAALKGWAIVRAITSTKQINNMLKNNEIKGYWSASNSAMPISRNGLIAWLEAYTGIEFVVNDAVYSDSLHGGVQRRFFDENTVTFLSTKGVLGAGLFGYTPEEELNIENTSESSLVTLTTWKESDPAAVWTKATGLYIPAPRSINKMFIAKVS